MSMPLRLQTTLKTGFSGESLSRPINYILIFKLNMFPCFLKSKEKKQLLTEVIRIIDCRFEHGIRD